VLPPTTIEVLTITDDEILRVPHERGPASLDVPEGAPARWRSPPARRAPDPSPLWMGRGRGVVAHRCEITIRSTTTPGLRTDAVNQW